MSEIKKIGIYTTDEILKHLTEGEGRGFLGRSMYDAIYFKIEELENQLQQKENSINKLEKDLEDMYYGRGKYHIDSDVIGIKDVLDKIKTLKAGVKNE